LLKQDEAELLQTAQLIAQLSTF